MRTARLITVVAVIFVCGADSLPRTDLPTVDTLPGHSIRLRDETRDPSQTEGIVEVFQWAIDRYERLSLELPSMTVTFYRQRSRCSEYDGFWTSWDGGMRIDMCVGGEKQRKRVLLHELAHAWVAVNLDEDTREAFMARLALPGWAGTDIERGSQGIELTAEIIMWGLDQQCESSELLMGIDPAQLPHEFQRLTGEEPLCVNRGSGYTT